MKNVKNFLLVASLFVLLSACSNKNDIDLTGISIENFPSSQQLSTVSKKQLNEIKLLSKTFPLQDCEKYFYDIINNILSDKKGVKLESVVFTEDILSQKDDKKPLQNLRFDINLKFDSTLNNDNINFEDDVASEIFDTLTRYTYFNFNVKETTVYKIFDNNTRQNLAACTVSPIQKEIFVQQSKEENFVQSQLLEYAKSKSGLLVKTFSITPKNNLLSITFNADEYIKNNQIALENVKQELGKISHDVKDLLLGNEISSLYIKNNKINNISIIFESHSFSPQNLTFDFVI